MQRDSIVTFTAGEIVAIADAIAGLARDLMRSVPAPRGAPFFGLDMDVRAPALLDELCHRGIFRKYERALVIGSGLGGAARWWATHFGCNVIGVESQPEIVRGATMLSRRAGLVQQTQFVIGDDIVLPCRDAALTHAWIDGDLTARGTAPVVREAFRVLRPGGVMGAVLAANGGEDCSGVLRTAGFINVQCRPARRVEAPHSLLMALRRLEACVDPQLDARAAAIRKFAAVAHTEIQRMSPVVQLFAERPS